MSYVVYGNKTKKSVAGMSAAPIMCVVFCGYPAADKKVAETC